jgi:signal transduction histidine kinase
MSEISFSVSARTARLIGQENFTNPDGAVLELVKNSYDADAKNCIVVFDIPFETIPEKIAVIDFEKYAVEYSGLLELYEIKNEWFCIKPNVSEDLLKELKEYFFSKNSIYIIDNGDGMNYEIIRDNWMMIGTGNKEFDYITEDNRIKTGAKGIGRFALDRLGFISEMWTVPKNKVDSNKDFYWRMDWRQFEAPLKSLYDIKASLEEKTIELKEILLDFVFKGNGMPEVLNKTSFFKGTILKISGLKDEWFVNNLSSVHKSLEALIPPKELSIPFSVNFYHLQNLSAYGDVETAFFDDYDYKVTAEFDAENLEVKMIITRNELDMAVVNNDYSYLFKDANYPYDIETLEQKEFSITKSIFELLKWKKNDVNLTLAKNLGKFSLSFYYIKSVVSLKENYPFNAVTAAERKQIIEKFGGVKIYRDSFRVRPYGEKGNDWLYLGERMAKSPASAGQRIGDWRVGPNQVAGIINISRIENADLMDKSDRGALIENKTFDIFKKIVIGVISEFELDRSIIMNLFYKDLKDKKEVEKNKEIMIEAEKLANIIIKKRDEEFTERSKPKIDFPSENKKQEKEAADRKEKADYENIFQNSLRKFHRDDDKDAEIAQVRNLASLGLIVSSFAHELKEIRNNVDEIKGLEKIFIGIVSDPQKKSQNYIDGIDIIELLKKDGEIIKHWVDYSLTTIKKDKRKRSALKFNTYFETLSKDWQNALNDRNITLSFDDKTIDDYEFRAFEMDMNTIFSNLISNSIDSFKSLTEIIDRRIDISYSIIDGQVQILYSDNGAGISNIFSQKEEIFLPFVSSKKDRNGNDIGTGLGMYLIKNVVTDNNGQIEILTPEKGFSLKIIFPIRKK